MRKSPPRLCVTVLTAAEAQPESIARLIERQRALDPLILYSPDLADRLTAPLQDLAVAVPFNSDEGRQLLKLRNYWSAVDAQLPNADCPVLVVRSGTWLPDRCWGRFYGVHGQQVRRIFPLSVRGECTGVFLRSDHDPGFAAEAIDHWLNQYCRRTQFDIPYPDGFTAFLPCHPTPPLREYSCSDAVFVDDRDTDPRHLPEDLPAAYLTAFRDRHPLTAMRHAMTELSQRTEQPPAELPRCTAVNLHLSHGWGGGLWRWIEDFCAHDDDAVNLILKPIGDRSAYAQTMELVDARRPHIPLLRKTFAAPILSTAVSHGEYQSLLDEICGRFSVTALYVSSLIGQSLDLLRTGLPTALVLHNFFPVCPAIIATYDGPCSSCDDARMADCFANNPRQQFFLSESQAHWYAVRRAFREAVAEGDVKLVSPSNSVVERFSAIFGADDALQVEVIPHGLPADDVPALEALRASVPEASGRLRVVILGGQESHKGGDLAALLTERLHDVVDFYLLGFGDDLSELDRHSHVKTLDSYTRPQLYEVLGTYKPHLGMLLSTVPETFSYTLSELRGAAIPTLASSLGAFVDRIEHSVDGWLCAPDASQLEAMLRHLDAHRDEIACARARLNSLEIRSAAAMVEDYRRVLPPIALAARGRPYTEDDGGYEAEGKLLVKEDVRYLEALREFLAYSSRKLTNSPRIGTGGRRVLRKLLGR